MIDQIESAYEKSNLPERIDETMIEQLLFEIRNDWYKENLY